MAHHERHARQILPIPRRALGLATMGATAALGLGGCTLSGSGTFASETLPNQKAGVVSMIECGLDGSGSGTISFIDRRTKTNGPRVNVEGTVTGCLGRVATGTYQPRPSGAPGTFKVTVADKAGTGPGKGDSMLLLLDGGRFDGYSFAGTLESGDFTITP